MKIVATAIPDVKLVEPRVFADARGWFCESWNEAHFAAAGIAARFVQDNHSASARGVLRGLHYQLHRPQGKLVRVVAGAAFDVAVDLRRGSPSFGRWVAAELDAANRLMLWIPPGFAHGVLALRDGTEVLYKCTEHYAPEDERAVAWDDPALAIDWPLARVGATTLSERDRAAPPLARAEIFA
jgi:dTDP-4-dehydrorhamnose 3,5-epimerase